VNYRIETSGINKVAVVINPLVDKDVEEIRECMINSIEIVDGKGWKGGQGNRTLIPLKTSNQTL